MASPEEIEERQRKQQHFQNALAEQVAQKEAAKAEKKRAQLEEERREVIRRHCLVYVHWRLVSIGS